MFRASASSESQDRNSTAREHCYMALTSLAHRLTTANTPELLFANLSLLRLLLHSLTLEGSVQAIRVSEALGASPASLLLASVGHTLLAVRASPPHHDMDGRHPFSC